MSTVVRANLAEVARQRHDTPITVPRLLLPVNVGTRLVAHRSQACQAPGQLRRLGVRKVWLTLNQEGIPVARRTVERLWLQEGLAGAVRSKIKRTTIVDASRPAGQRSRDLVRRDFAPAAAVRLWLADGSYVSTWSGWAYVAFVIDAFDRRIIGFQCGSAMSTPAGPGLARARSARFGGFLACPQVYGPIHGGTVNSLARDLGILGVLIVAGLVWSLFGVVTRRRHRAVTKAQDQQVAREHTEAQPIPGLAAHASTVGWTGPSATPPPDPTTVDYIREMARTFAGEASTLLHDNFSVGETRYANVFAGEVDGRHVSFGNTFTNLTPNSPDYVGAGTDVTASFVVLDLPATLPPLVVSLRRYPSYRVPLVKGWTLESDDFNRRFLVMALDRKYASDMVSPRVMELLMTRDDWVFLIAMSRLVCVCKTPFTGVDELEERVGAVVRFAKLAPAFVAQDRGLAMPTLPDGTSFDPTDPASVEKLKAAFATMTPQEQRAFLTQVQAAGARFVLGAFGKDLPPHA